MKDGGPAFPFRVNEGTSVRDSFPGLTKREWFAGMALQGVLSNPEGFPAIMSGSQMCRISPGEFLVQACHEYADAMIAEDIDRETHLPALLAVAEAAKKYMSAMDGSRAHDIGDTLHFLRAALEGLKGLEEVGEKS